jgi:hypothetical protein
MAQFTLDDIRAAAEAKYGATEITDGAEVIARLVNPLRLSSVKRAALKAAQEGLNAAQDREGGEDSTDVVIAHLRDAIRAVAETEAQAARLLSLAGDDAAVLVSIFETYNKHEALPEA